MTDWLMGIVGVVFLGVLFDLIYPNGKTNVFCRNVFGVLSLIMIINPLLKIDFNKIQYDDLTNEQIVSNINSSRCENLRLQIEQHLQLRGFDGIDVEIDILMQNNEFNIENIYLDITNLVLSDDLLNINKYEVIRSEVAEVTKVDKERIIVYG